MYVMCSSYLLLVERNIYMYTQCAIKFPTKKSSAKTGLMEHRAGAGAGASVVVGAAPGLVLLNFGGDRIPSRQYRK